MKTISNNIIRQVLLLLAILLVAGLLFWQLIGFLPAALGAYTLFVLLKKWMYRLVEKHRWKKGLAASLLMFLSFIIIMLPVVGLIDLVTSKINYALQNTNHLLATLQGLIHQWEKRYHVHLISDQNIQRLTSWSAEYLQKLVGATFNGVVTIAFCYFILYFLLTGGRKMEARWLEWMPLKNENVRQLGHETEAMVYSNAIGIPLIALLQGTLGLIAYLILGVSQPLFWFLMTCLASMIPVVGAALAYVPVSLVLLGHGQTVQGVIMLAWGFGIISTLDSVFRFWLQKKMGDVHPLITAFGVIVGLNLFGFLGLIFGPILISLFLLLIKIYANEFSLEKIA